MTARSLLIVAIVGHPLVFGVFFGLSGMLSQVTLRFMTSFLAELIALGIGVTAIIGALRALKASQFSMPTKADEWLVHGVSAIYILLIGIIVANSGSLGLLSTGSRLDFYFENNWYRRIVTFSTIPYAVATYLSVSALLSPQYVGRRAAFVVNLLLLFVMSLLAGSKGAAVLAVVTSLGFVYSAKRIPVARIAVVVALAASAYVAIFLFFTSQRYLTVFALVLRFYQSIDMSLLLQDQGTTELIATRLGGVWTEIFRNLSAFGVRVSELPIGTVIYQQAAGIGGNIGSNCRFGSLLLLYPERIDFLIGYPLLVIATAGLMSSVLSIFDMRRTAVVAVPLFIFASFQDVYWWSSHVVPLLLAFAFAHTARIVSNEVVDHPSHAR